MTTLVSYASAGAVTSEPRLRPRVKITPDCAGKMPPFERSIQRIKSIQCRVAIGTQDEYVTVEEMHYYHHLAAKSVNIDFRVLNGCVHTLGTAGTDWSAFEAEVLPWLLE